MKELIFDSSIPLYQQLEQMLLSEIHAGILSAGSRLSTEHEMSSAYHVSRVTVRKALARLEEAGYIERKIGKGTYVTSQKLQRKLSGNVSSFTRMCQEMGTVPSSRTIRKELIVPGENDRIRMGLEAGESAVLIERIRCSNDEPVMIERDLFSQDFSFLINEDLDTASLYETIRKNRNIYFSRSARTVDVVFATASEAALLGLRVAYPLLRIAAITQDETGAVTTLSEQLCIGDRFKLQV